ncbi:MAG: sugar phosphate isomerase/epimerase [Victivallaceae bacterium]|jgi:sugar phosphate isomerase/epimerase|nr:sugar phosphate isomerase/epimerase [Victivallaceae bacterium]
MKVLMHVNYCEGAGKLEELFSLARKYGYDGIELRWKYNFDDLTQDEYQNRVASMKSAWPEAEIVFGGCIDFCRGEPEQVAVALDEYLAFLQWASKECGTKVMNFFTGSLKLADIPHWNFDRHGSGCATEDDFRRAADGLRLVGDAAAAENMMIALETHNLYLHDLAKPCRRLLGMTGHDAVGVNYDHGNIILNKDGESIADVFEIIADKIYYAHLKNMFIVGGSDGHYICTRLADGHINTRSVMLGLKKYLRSGMIALEYPNPGDKHYAAFKDMEYIKYLKTELDIE